MGWSILFTIGIIGAIGITISGIVVSNGQLFTAGVIIIIIIGFLVIKKDGGKAQEERNEFARSFREKEVIRKIDGANFGNLFPKDPRLSIEYVCISAKKNRLPDLDYFFSFDIGFAVENTSTENMRVQFTIAQTDKDGYVVHTHHIWNDIVPGERRRFWADIFDLRESEQFSYFRLRDISVGPTPTEGWKGLATWSAVSSPNKSIFDIFELGSNPLPKSPQPRPSTCFIATAAYGTDNHDDVIFLKKFRDQYLRHHKFGRKFIANYYRISPRIASYIRQEDSLKLTVQRLIHILVFILKTVIGTHTGRGL